MVENDHNCECSACAERYAALVEIAAFNDKAANRGLERTGRYGLFDEPNAVEIARKVLGKHGT